MQRSLYAGNFATCTAQGLAAYADRSDPFAAQNSPRLLTSGCWLERLSPAFSAYPPSAEPAELHQELLLGFDVCEGFEHSVLSMVVKKNLAREGKGSGWFADLQVCMHMPACLASLLHCRCYMFSLGTNCCWTPPTLLMHEVKDKEVKDRE